MILLISYGNALRGDDGAGQVLGDWLEHAWQEAGAPVRRLSLHALTPETAAAIAAEDVDAVFFTDAEPAEPRTAALHLRPLYPAAGSPALGHQLAPETLLALAAQLYDRQPPTWLITLPAVSFGLGEAFSETTQQALACARLLLMAMLGQGAERERGQS